MSKNRSTIGWREWVSMPDLSIDWIKVKVDTGARTSVLHTTELEIFSAEDGSEHVRFLICPRQRSTGGAVQAESQLLGRRSVKSSSGNVELRPVISTVAIVDNTDLQIELTLTRRDDMGFRMLLGRQAIRRKFVVDPARSYLGPRPPRPVIARNWRTKND